MSEDHDQEPTDGAEVVVLQEKRLDRLVEGIQAIQRGRLVEIGGSLGDLGRALAGEPALEVVEQIRDLLVDVIGELGDWCNIRPLEPDDVEHLFERYYIEVLGEDPYGWMGDEDPEPEEA